MDIFVYLLLEDEHEKGFKYEMENIYFYKINESYLEKSD
ncbi:hypothetical protein BLGI_4706 [Brevibacillus laterosporus GI-9]|nr:hypothetical protein BLGI_4706 [Brevibacillus laterosporus GI-9]